MKRTALVTGITGQDGAYLGKLLLEKGYTVYGLMQRSTRYAFANLDYLGVTPEIDYIDGDLTDEASLINAVCRTRPDEIYNLAAQSFVGTSWDQPISTTEINAVGTLKLLEAARRHAPQAKFYQASTSEMFGNCHQDGIQTEETPFHPRSPRWLGRDWPSTAGSLREGLAEMFTINRLNLPGSLRRCLAASNLIDSTDSGVFQRARRVTNRQHGNMALRCVAASFGETEKSYRPP